MGDARGLVGRWEWGGMKLTDLGIIQGVQGTPVSLLQFASSIISRTVALQSHDVTWRCVCSGNVREQ